MKSKSPLVKLILELIFADLLMVSSCVLIVYGYRRWETKTRPQQDGGKLRNFRKVNTFQRQWPQWMNLKQTDKKKKKQKIRVEWYICKSWPWVTIEYIDKERRKNICMRISNTIRIHTRLRAEFILAMWSKTLRYDPEYIVKITKIHKLWRNSKNMKYEMRRSNVCLSFRRIKRKKSKRIKELNFSRINESHKSWD